MALTSQQQAFELISRAKRILIVSPSSSQPEHLASALACHLFLKKLGKEADVVIPGIDPTHIPSFLPATDILRPHLGAIRASIVSVNVQHVPLEELMYDVRDGHLDITLVPRAGQWTQQDVEFKQGEDRYSLVIALDAADMHALGEIAQEHADFLYRTTILNIDHNASNEHWGQVNIVDLNAVSTTEVLMNLFENWNRNIIDEDIATALLTGMISSTHSFRTSNVTPKTLATASQLIALGARREQIVHGLWRTRDIATLKLWGRALSRLEQDREHGIVWCMMSRQDFVETGTNESSLADVVHELIGYAPEARVIVLAHEHADTPEKMSIHATIFATAPLSAQELGRSFGAQGSRNTVRAILPPGSTLIDGTRAIIDRIRETLKMIRT